jgi:hypothetical protein
MSHPKPENEARREYFKNYKRKCRLNPKKREKELESSQRWRKNHWTAYHQKLRMDVLTAYGGNPPKCACCGESHVEFLVLDHIKGGGNKERRKRGGGWAVYSYLRRHGYPKGYTVLCQNCNSAKAFYGYCPHERKEDMVE